MAKAYVVDIETAPLVVRTWSMWGANISPDNIIEDRRILCIAWREVGGRRTYSSRVGADKTERQVVAEFRAGVDDADILIGHNYQAFDAKHLTAKLIEHDLEPFHKLHVVDTLKEVKKVAKFSSNRLDFLCRKLLGQQKLDTDMDLWVACMAGDEKALSRMERYCRHDVEMTEALYLKLRPYFRTHPNVAESGTDRCPRCNCDASITRKRYVTKAGLERDHRVCVACRAPFTIAAKPNDRPLSVA